MFVVAVETWNTFELSYKSVTALEKETGFKNILAVVKSLLDKEAVFVKEELRGSYKPKTEVRVKLRAGMQDEQHLQQLFDEIGRRAPKQLDLLMKYLELSGFMSGAVKEVAKGELIQCSGASPAVFKALVDRGVFELYKQDK